LFVVASIGIPIRGQDDMHVVIFIGTILVFSFGEISLGMELGIHGQLDGLCGLSWGVTPTKEE